MGGISVILAVCSGSSQIAFTMICQRRGWKKVKGEWGFIPVDMLDQDESRLLGRPSLCLLSVGSKVEWKQIASCGGAVKMFYTE